MYEKFYGFNKKPFELVPNPDFLYLSKVHRKALSYLEYGLSSRAGFILLTGDIGSGKTTIVRSLLERLESRTIPARVFNTKADAKQLLFMINEDFGLSPQSKDKMAMLSDLNEFLVQKFANNERPVLIIDEAQNLTSDCLEEVRLLSNLEAKNSKLLQIVLVGQPELKTIIAQPRLQQLRQRISVDCHLTGLSEDETQEYFYHRLECAGNANDIVFPDGFFERVHKFCGGIPRLINILGDYLLLAGFSEGKKTLDSEMINDVLNDLKGNVAFSDVNNCIAGGNVTALPRPYRTSPENNEWPELETEIPDEILSRLQKHENIIKKIIKKQIAQSMTTSQRLEEIGASLTYIEAILQRLTRSQFATPHTKKFTSGVSQRLKRYRRGAKKE